MCIELAANSMDQPIDKVIHLVSILLEKQSLLCTYVVESETYDIDDLGTLSILSSTFSSVISFDPPRISGRKHIQNI